jgi:DNA primase
MSRMSFTDAAERVKSGLDIVDIIQRHVILKKSGRNYMGKCPFHNDKSPSMNVSREKGIFKCFACGVGGDALTFIMRLKNQTFGEVIRELAEDQGIEIIEEGRNPEVALQQRDAKQKILDLNLTANRWFQDRLHDPAAEPIIQYLARRYPDAAMREAAISQFQIGYAPAGW